MTLCNDNHDEVCYEGNRCPMGAVIEAKEGEIDKLKDIVREQKEKIDVLEEQVANYQTDES